MASASGMGPCEAAVPYPTAQHTHITAPDSGIEQVPTAQCRREQGDWILNLEK